jgi:UDP-hydrolysing UDP-N-acetyl-D-glucosamine 2-epimerase
LPSRSKANPVRTHVATTPAIASLNVAVITGTRAEFGLLTHVMHAIAKHPRLNLQVIAGGAHLLPPARTLRDVRALFPIAATVPMQRPGKSGRLEDARALARGVDGFARAFAKLKPDWVVVLGDRIEAFAAASAASIAGIAVCHIHGGDRAEGIADEAMRHAITKLSHLHCAATKLSAQRILKMGEKPEHVHVTGSPSIDGLDAVRPMSHVEARTLGDPSGIILLHPWGAAPEQTRQVANDIAVACAIALGSDDGPDVLNIDGRALWLMPNHDPGRNEIVNEMRSWECEQFRLCEHLPRPTLLALFKRLSRQPGGVLVGNSSAGLIEAAAIGLPVVNVGDRQAGRERAANVVDVPLRSSLDDLSSDLIGAIERATSKSPKPSTLFGDGRSAPRIAKLLASINPREPSLLRKRIVY